MVATSYDVFYAFETWISFDFLQWQMCIFMTEINSLENWIIIWLMKSSQKDEAFLKTITVEFSTKFKISLLNFQAIFTQPVDMLENIHEQKIDSRIISSKPWNETSRKNNIADTHWIYLLKGYWLYRCHQTVSKYSPFTLWTEKCLEYLAIFYLFSSRTPTIHPSMLCGACLHDKHLP